MSSRAVAVIHSVENTLGTLIRKANGYYYDLLPESVLPIKKDLETDGSGLLRASVYSTGYENQQQGTDASYGQVLKTYHMHVDGCVAVQTDDEEEIGNALADIERALMKDISQGGTVINTWVTGGERYQTSPNGFGAFTVSFDVLIRHAVNDPSIENQVTYN